MRIEGAALYALLRTLTSPIVAITTSAQGRMNGMIANSAQRASLLPSLPRVSVYVSKTNFTHDLLYRSGVFGLHLLRSDQWEVVRILGLQSGREIRKLRIGDDETRACVEARLGELGCPMLVDCYAAFECRVVNAMDSGASTFFLGDVVAAESDARGELMTSEYFRLELPDEMRAVYEARLAAAQRELERLGRKVERAAWPGAVVGP